MQTLIDFAQVSGDAMPGPWDWGSVAAGIVASVSGAFLTASRLSAPARYEAAARRCLNLAGELPKDSPARASLVATAEWYGARIAARRMVYSDLGTWVGSGVTVVAVFALLVWWSVTGPRDGLTVGEAWALVAYLVALSALGLWRMFDVDTSRAAVMRTILAGDAPLTEWVGPSGYLDTRRVRDLRRSLRPPARAGGRAGWMRRWFSWWGRR